MIVISPFFVQKKLNPLYTDTAIFVSLIFWQAKSKLALATATLGLAWLGLAWLGLAWLLTTMLSF